MQTQRVKEYFSSGVCVAGEAARHTHPFCGKNFGWLAANSFACLQNLLVHLQNARHHFIQCEFGTHARAPSRAQSRA